MFHGDGNDLVHLGFAEVLRTPPVIDRNSFEEHIPLQVAQTEGAAHHGGIHRLGILAGDEGFQGKLLKDVLGNNAHPGAVLLVVGRAVVSALLHVKADRVVIHHHDAHDLVGFALHVFLLADPPIVPVHDVGMGQHFERILDVC